MVNIDDYKQILKDIGCNNDEIKYFLECENREKRLKLLETKRRDLLDDYHFAARRIDCLDYLASEISKECS